jgi:hypothetical protein
MLQGTKSVTARIPQELYDKCNQQYKNMTDAVIEGLKLLCKTDCKTEVITIGETNIQIEERDIKIKELQNLNDSLLKELENHKEPSKEILELYDFRIKDLQAHNETLKKELEDNKQMHNNYMLQMQTVINQKAIEAPGAKKPWWQFW